MPITEGIYYHLYAGCEVGERPPVVLIHGAGGTHLYWPPEVRRLPGYRVYALDLPGHGKSGGRGFQSIPAYARAVLDWLGVVGFHRAVFVGHSMGSAVGLSLALDYPTQVLGLGLLSAGARLRVAPLLLEAVASVTTFTTAVETMVNWAFSSLAPTRVVQLAAQRMGETRPAVLHGDFLACDTFDVIGRIGQIQCPTLVVCGEEDKLTPLRYSQFLVDNIPGASLKTIPAAGHMVMLEKPQEVASALVDFLVSIS